MVAEQAPPKLKYKGSAAQKELGARMFEIMRAHSMFSADYAAIRVSTERLAEFLESSADKVQAAAEKNPHVFALESLDDETFVVTTRVGAPPVHVNLDTRHSFAARFMTPEPAPERPLRTEKPIPQVVINAEVARELEEAEDETTSVEYELRTEDLIDVGASSESADITVEIISEEEAKPEVTEVVAATDSEAFADIVEEVETEPLPEVPEIAAVEEPITEQDAPEAIPLAEEAEPTPAPSDDSVESLTDVSAFDDTELAAAIRGALASDRRFANFGDSWMAESEVHRLSRGNLRGLAEYINEQEQPLTDDVLVQDVIGTRRTSADFAAMRFSLNFRLLSERNFEFVGTTDQPFWGTTDLQPIGTTRRKASDIGTDYRFLIDEVAQASVEPRSATTVEHTLSFYEFTYGLLPLDEKMMALLPAPVMPDQRAAVMTFEIPQFENSVYLVEVRYPTPTRGGFLMGLDDFYDEKLVPGAMLSIQATDNNGHYKIEYLEDEDRQDRFLELDDRRAAKYVFRPLTYDTAVDEQWLVTEDRFPRLSAEKPLSEKRRRRVEDVIEETFKRVGEEDGSKLTASFSDILVAVNIERPASESYLRTAIESMTSVSDDGAGTLTYDPSA